MDKLTVTRDEGSLEYSSQTVALFGVSTELFLFLRKRDGEGCSSSLASSAVPSLLFVRREKKPAVPSAGSHAIM